MAFNFSQSDKNLKLIKCSKVKAFKKLHTNLVHCDALELWQTADQNLCSLESADLPIDTFSINMLYWR